MGRIKRVWVPDLFYHIVSRGNRRDVLFRDEYDFNVFISILQDVNMKTPFELASYCFMTNHYHLQLRSSQQPVSKVMSLINKRYADYYNTRNNLSGHVFEKRYYGKVIPSKQGMLEVSRYIHLNPVEAGIVKQPEEYWWSSYGIYLYGDYAHSLNTEEILSCFSGDEREKVRKYQQFVETGDVRCLSLPENCRM